MILRLRAYLWGKALWNPDMTQEEFDGYLNDFMNYFYGDAAPLLMKYLDTLNNSVTENLKHDKFMKGHSGAFADYRIFMNLVDDEGNFTTEFVEELAAIWEEIYALETLTEEQQLRVDHAAIAFYEAAGESMRYIGTSLHDYHYNKPAKTYKSMSSELQQKIKQTVEPTETP